jgi:hypothetical protein
MFSYDDFEVNEELMSRFNLVKEFRPDYPLNIHIDPYVGLYRLKDGLE